MHRGGAPGGRGEWVQAGRGAGSGPGRSSVVCPGSRPAASLGLVPGPGVRRPGQPRRVP